MERGLVPNKLVPAFREAVEELKNLLPITQVSSSITLHSHLHCSIGLSLPLPSVLVHL